MLVDNGVVGDSRVQKSARSAAAAGWEVILVGISGDSEPHSWQIGQAEVRLVPVHYALSSPYGRLRYARWRRPLAYAPGEQAGYRVQLKKGRKADVVARLAQLKARRSAGKGRPADALAGLGLRLANVTASIGLTWTRLRAGQLTRVRQANQKNSLLNRVQIAFWRKVLGSRSWRRLDPGLWDYELAFGPVIDQLNADIIHANDFRMLGVGVRATARARARGRQVKLVWDAHESVSGVMPRAANPRWHPAQIDHVREYAPYADAVVTVSPTLSAMLREEHKLPTMPSVVLNAPVCAPDEHQRGKAVPDLRGLCGIGPDVPLLVYCGGVNPRRGVDTMIEALPRLPGVHVALVTLHPTGANKASHELAARAAAAGVGDRVHLLPYVEHWQVAPFLAAANIGVIPLHHQPNHEIALITKFFEYSHARLPIVVSDVQAMAQTVRETGQGEVFTALDLDGYVSAVQAVLADPERYRAAYDRPGLLQNWTWEAQADVLDGVYAGLMPGRPAAPTTARRDPAASLA
ncbi:glycosyltransferase family 4 protein [Catellatospora vulcania]|uniref:glycosyltransferase family 4 protein n=1 Tax=Catellatospora vulcania TaxID=1460450 RepID=UPI0012D37FA9